MISYMFHLSDIKFDFGHDGYGFTAILNDGPEVVSRVRCEGTGNIEYLDASAEELSSFFDYIDHLPKREFMGKMLSESDYTWMSEIVNKSRSV